MPYDDLLKPITEFTMDLFQQVAALVKEGHGRVVIAERLGLSKGKASRMITKVRNAEPELEPAKKDYSARSNKLQEIQDLVEEFNYDTWDISERFKTSPTTVQGYLKKIAGTYSPAEEWVRKASKHGVKYSELQTKLGIKTIDKGVEILKQTFPECFISVIKEGEDYHLTAVPDSSGQVESLNVDVSRRKDLFEYYVSPFKNYMKVKFNDNLPGDELKVWNFTDLHDKSKACRTNMLMSCIESVGEDPMSFIQWGGDSFENNSPLSAGSEFDQYAPPHEQVTASAKFMGSVAYKSVDYMIGNHEERTQRFSGLNIGQVLGDIVKIPTFDQGVFIEYEWRGIKKIQYHCHRFRNLYEQAAIVNAVRKLSQKLTFPLAWSSSGHNHNSFIQPIETQVIVSGRGFEGSETLVVNGGCFTQDSGMYSEGFGRSPKDLTFITMHENGEHGAGAIRIRSL